MSFSQPDPSWHYQLHHEASNDYQDVGARLHFKLSVSTICLGLALIFLLLNLKNLPGMWHMRLINAFRFILRTQRPPITPTASHIFQPLITSSSAQLLEIDLNMHKSNSSYFSDLDISRTHLVCTLFAQGIAHMRGGTEAYTGSKNPHFGLALGAVSCSFRKEVLPYQQYDMWSRILTWDDKWIYIVTHFVRKGTADPESFSLYPATGATKSTAGRDCSDTDEKVAAGRGDPMDARKSADSRIFATALSKCVFKSGRKTVSPHSMMEASDLLPYGTDTQASQDVEAQRIKGLELCSALAAQNQKALDDEFGAPDGHVLGRHTDSSGVVGVVSTLMQLAGLKKSQAL